MSCFRPLNGYYSKDRTETGKRSVVFNVQTGYLDRPVTVPCGRCIGCRLDKSRQWAARLMHENQMHQLSSFVTLTYSDEFVPDGGTLVKRDFQLFMKRLRKFHKAPIRFFHCGEYGEQTGRPHYHALLFGIDFADKTYHSTSPSGHRIFRSETLNNIWGMGHCLIGTVNFESSAYVARYIMKKVSGEKAEDHYKRIHPETGEIYYLQPEYITMSLKPAIGREWYEKFKAEVFPSDFIVMNGTEMTVPKYYRQLIKVEDEKLSDQMKYRRIKQAAKQKEHQTTQRLITRETVKSAQVGQLKRKL